MLARSLLAGDVWTGTVPTTLLKPMELTMILSPRRAVTACKEGIVAGTISKAWIVAVTNASAAATAHSPVFAPTSKTTRGSNGANRLNNAPSPFSVMSYSLLCQEYSPAVMSSARAALLGSKWPVITCDANQRVSRGERRGAT